jgi:hypothetical protein
MISQPAIKPASWWQTLQQRWLNWHRKRMVGWYNPIQLVKTGRDVLISTIVGRHSDRRLVEALTAEDAWVFDYRGQFRKTRLEQCKWKGERAFEGAPREDFWLDYVADVGDGWNPTYGVAYWLAQETLRPQHAGQPADLKRGSVLIFGGDQVYPMASREQYQHRLVEPYRDAMDRPPDPAPHVYAIPGNHDWYDSLAAFTGLFCDETTRQFADGRWETPQNRSYFALRLPGKWWLLGIDLQLSSDLDAMQLRYFQTVAEQMEPGDRVILCSPEPYWIYQIAYGENDANKDTRLNQGYLETHIFGPRKVRVALYLAGDLHHYFHLRHNGAHKITAGGGGAFMHPTHGEFGKSFDREAELRGAEVCKRFPEASESSRRCWRNLFFPFLNPLFGIVTALLYWLTAWTVMGAARRTQTLVANWNWAAAWEYTAQTLVGSPVALPWILAILAGFFLFTDTHSRLYRFVGGLAHGLTHLAMVFAVGWTAYWLNPWPLDADASPAPIVKWWGMVMLGGYLVGAVVMGIYLLISLNLFGRHSTEALSSLRTQDWKNFLRLKIDSDGHLTIYPIGIRRVARKWRERGPDEDGISKYRPEGAHLEPELIEAPIHIN